MAKIYVVGKNLERAKVCMEALRKNGHTITFDWIVDIDKETDSIKKEKALLEREGVREADILVYLWESNQESARYEAGMAMGLGKPLIVSGSHDSFFFTLPEIIRVQSDDEILSVIEKTA